MNWIEIRAVFEPEPVDWSPMIEVFRNFGCENTLLEDNPPTIVACVSVVDGSAEIVEQIVAGLRDQNATSVETKEVPDVDWSEIWKQHFKPRRVGERFVIKPSWEPFEASPDDLIIELDPGQAFGTGEHPTTRGCLSLMESIDFKGKNVADVGCGSGVLSVGAKLLGAETVRGVDIEQIAVEVAKLNASANGFDIEFVCGNGFDVMPAGPYDIILSNIVSAVLIGLASRVATRLQPGGYWLVSGILEPNWDDVLVAANRQGFKFVRDLREDQWVSALFQR